MLLLGCSGSEVFGFDVFGFSTAAFGSPFGEEGTESEIFFWWNAVTLDEGIVWQGSLCEVRCWDVGEVFEECVNMEGVQPSLQKVKVSKTQRNLQE